MIGHNLLDYLRFLPCCLHCSQTDHDLRGAHFDFVMDGISSFIVLNAQKNQAQLSTSVRCLVP